MSSTRKGKKIFSICWLSKKTEQPFGNSENQLPRASLFGAPKTRARENRMKFRVKLGAGSFFTKP